eukprot:265007-Pleurochrysis_carterae.AAC.1
MRVRAGTCVRARARARACVCVRARARACACACVCVRVRACVRLCENGRVDPNRFEREEEVDVEAGREGEEARDARRTASKLRVRPNATETKCQCSTETKWLYPTKTVGKTPALTGHKSKKRIGRRTWPWVPCWTRSSLCGEMRTVVYEGQGRGGRSKLQGIGSALVPNRQQPLLGKRRSGAPKPRAPVAVGTTRFRMRAASARRACVRSPGAEADTHERVQHREQVELESFQLALRLGRDGAAAAAAADQLDQRLRSSQIGENNVQRVLRGHGSEYAISLLLSQKSDFS